MHRARAGFVHYRIIDHLTGLQDIAKRYFKRSMYCGTQSSLLLQIILSTHAHASNTPYEQKEHRLTKRALTAEDQFGYPACARNKMLLRYGRERNACYAPMNYFTDVLDPISNVGVPRLLSFPRVQNCSVEDLIRHKGEASIRPCAHPERNGL